VTAALVGRRSTLVYATVIALLALVPLLFLRDPVGAFVRPAVLVFVLAALASFVVALLVTPVMAVLLAGRAEVPARSAPFARSARAAFDRTSGRAVGRTVPGILGLLVLAALLAIGLPALGSGTLLPQLEDRNVLVRLEAAPGTSLAEMDRVTGLAAAELAGLGGVESVAMHVGRAVGADEVVDVDAGEIWLTIADDADYGNTLADVRATVAAYPGLHSTVSTYADDRISAVSASTGDDLVVRVTGADYATLQRTAEDVALAMKTVEGVILPEVEPLVSQPTVSVEVDLAAARALGLRPGDVRREVSTLVSGLTVGSLYEQQAIFDVVVWGGPQTRANIEELESLLVYTPSGTPVRLGDVAAVDVSPTPTVITRQGVSRSLDVVAEVRGRSAEEVAAAATERIRQMTFEEDYRAEVISDAVERADARQTVLLAIGAAAVLVFLLLQAAANSWRGAAVLFVVTPLAATGALLTGYALDGAWSAGVLAAMGAVAALAIRQSLVLVRRAQVLYADEAQPADALRAAAREQTPAVLVTVLATAAAFLPAAVLGGAGLEILRPFAIALIAGLVTTTLVVLFVVPALYALLQGLRPAPVVGPDTPDGVPVGTAAAEHHGKHQRAEGADLESSREGRREGGAAMRTARPYGIASLFVAAAVGLAGCQSEAAGAGAEEAIAAAASVEPAADGGPAVLHLTDESVLRLGIQTETVGGAPGNLSVPYAAVVYDADGDTWAFAELEPGTYQRASITISSVDGENVVLSDGPAPGTPVVTVGAAELVGVEAGISGGE
jgi:Cu/Ag efflux pump CusA